MTCLKTTYRSIIFAFLWLTTACGIGTQKDSKESSLNQSAQSQSDESSPSDFAPYPEVKALKSFTIKIEPKPGILIPNGYCDVPKDTTFAVINDQLAAPDNIEQKVRIALKRPIHHPLNSASPGSECNLLVETLEDLSNNSPNDNEVAVSAAQNTIPTASERQSNAQHDGYVYVYEGWIPAFEGAFRSGYGLYEIIQGRFLNRVATVQGQVAEDQSGSTDSTDTMVFPVERREGINGLIDSFLNVGAALFNSNRGNRKHAACDIYGHVGTNILSITKGKIMASYYFYRGTYAIDAEHYDDQGNFLFTARYGEVKDQVGSRNITAGERIGSMGKMDGIAQAMLHFEYYENTYGNGGLTARGNAPFQRRSDLRDCTDFLKNLKEG